MILIVPAWRGGAGASCFVKWCDSGARRGFRTASGDPSKIAKGSGLCNRDRGANKRSQIICVDVYDVLLLREREADNRVTGSGSLAGYIEPIANRRLLLQCRSWESSREHREADREEDRPGGASARTVL